MEEFQPEQKVRKPTEAEITEMKASAKRNIALCILPSLITSHTKMSPVTLVKRAYDIAQQMVIQGDKA